MVLATLISFGQLGNLGLGSALTKLVAEEYAVGNHNLIRRYVSISTLFLAASGGVLILAGLVLRDEIANLAGATPDQQVELSRLVPWVALVSVMVLFSQISLGVLAGIGRFDLAHYTELGGRVASLGSASVLLMAGHGIESLLVGAALSAVASVVVPLLLVRLATGDSFVTWPRFERDAAQRLLGFGSNVLGGTVLNLLLAPTHKLLLASAAGPASVPVYEIAYAGAMQVRGVVEVGLRALMPEASRLARARAGSGIIDIARLFSKAMRSLVLLGTPIYVVLFAGASLLLELWLREANLPELSLAFRVMLVASFFSLLAVPAYHLLMGVGAAFKCFIGHLIQTGIAFGLSLILWASTATLTAVDAATTILLAFAGSTLYYILAYRLQLGILREEMTAPSDTLERNRA